MGAPKNQTDLIWYESVRASKGKRIKQSERKGG